MSIPFTKALLQVEDEWVRKKLEVSDTQRYLSKADVSKFNCMLGYGVTTITLTGPSQNFTLSSIREILEASTAQIFAKGYYTSTFSSTANIITSTPDHPCADIHKIAFERLKKANKAFQDACKKTGLKASWEFSQ